MDNVLTNTTPGPRGPRSGVGPGHLFYEAPGWSSWTGRLGHPGSGVLILDTQLGGCGALLFSIKSVPDPVDPELR